MTGIILNFWVELYTVTCSHTHPCVWKYSLTIFGKRERDPPLWAPKPTADAWVTGRISNSESQSSKGSYEYDFFLLGMKKLRSRMGTWSESHDLLIVGPYEKPGLLTWCPLLFFSVLPYCSFQGDKEKYLLARNYLAIWAWDQVWVSFSLPALHFA